MLKQFNLHRFLQNFFIVLIFVLALISRLIEIQKPDGGDFLTYAFTNTKFLQGQNIYKETVTSYELSEKEGSGYDDADHGYAYLPGILYINALFFYLAKLIQIPVYVSWRLPNLICDLLVGIVLVKIIDRKNYFYLVLGLVFWFFNANFLVDRTSGRYDAIPTLFTLLALYYLGKNDKYSGIFYSVGVLIKTYPLILLPLFLFRSINKYKFILSAAFIGFISSLPFLKSIQDFTYYIKGSFFVHGDRSLQGRPFLFFASYYLDIIFLRYIKTSYYALLAFFGAFTTSFLSLIKRLDKYLIATLSLFIFFLFSPVFNKTYFIWILPIYVLSMFNLSQKFKHARFVYLTSLVLFWMFTLRYLYIWDDGFQDWRPAGIFFDH